MCVCLRSNIYVRMHAVVIFAFVWKIKQVVTVVVNFLYLQELVPYRRLSMRTQVRHEVTTSCPSFRRAGGITIAFSILSAFGCVY